MWIIPFLSGWRNFSKHLVAGLGDVYALEKNIDIPDLQNAPVERQIYV